MPVYIFIKLKIFLIHRYFRISQINTKISFNPCLLKYIIKASVILYIKYIQGISKTFPTLDTFESARYT